MKKSRNPIISADTELAEIILRDPGTILFMEHFGITPPLKNTTIDEYCKGAGIRPGLFISFYSLYMEIGNSVADDIRQEDMPVIMKFLENSHNYFISEIYPEIRKLIKALREVNNSYEIGLVDKFFNEYFKEVKEHLSYEEKIVFPYIRELYKTIDKKKKNSSKPEYSVSDYKKHHNDIEEKLDDLMNLLIRYLPGNNDRAERRKLLKSIHELNDDLRVHQKIEDRVLIPLVEKAEKLARSKNG